MGARREQEPEQYQGNGTIMLRKTIWKKKTFGGALKFLSRKCSKANSAKLWKIIRPHYLFALFGFVEVKKFRDSGEISDWVHNGWEK